MYSIIIFPVVSALIAQVSKLLLKTNGRKFRLKNIFAYSGMPSGHSAMVISLTTIIGLEEGIASPLFGFSLIFALIVIRDAVGIRSYLGQHGATLNTLVKDLGEDSMLDKSYPRLLERIGHTPLQALVGGLIGFSVSWVGFILS